MILLIVCKTRINSEQNNSNFRLRAIIPTFDLLFVVERVVIVLLFLLLQLEDGGEQEGRQVGEQAARRRLLQRRAQPVYSIQRHT